MRPTIKILEEELKEKVVNEAFEILEEIGFFVENEEASEILQKAGIKIDKKKKAKIPRDLIKKSLKTLNINEWGYLCRGFLTEKNIDPFKFLIRFYANLENYCNSAINNSKEKDMYQKIKESDFPQQLEDLLDETRKLRNKVVHESYDLNEDDAELIKNAFLAFLSYLISTELAKLKLKSQVENIEYNFINKKGLLWEIKRFLRVDLGEILKFQGYYHNFLVPILDDLGIPN